MKFALALGLGASSLGTAAWAQEVPSRRVDIGASLVSTYDSNLLRLPDDATGPAGRPRHDFRLTPAVTLDLAVPLGRQGAFLNGAVGYDFHAINEQLDSANLQLSGGALLNLATCGSRLSAFIARQQSDLADLRRGELGEPLPEERLRNVQTTTRYEGRITCGSPAGLRPAISYRHEQVENADRERRDGNHTTRTVGAEILYARPVLGELSIGGTYSRGRYDDRIIVPGQAGGSPAAPLETYSVRAKFTREFGSQLTGSASIGHTRVDPNLAGVKGFRGLSWAADLTFTPGTRIQATFGASREAEQSNLLSISYAIVDSYRAAAQYAFNERLTLTARTGYTRRSLRDSALTPGALIETEDRTYRAAAGATLQLGNRLSFALVGGGEWRRSGTDDFNYNNVSIALTTRLSL